MKSCNCHHRNTKAHKDCYKQLYANKIDNLEETDTFLEKQSTKTEPGINRKCDENNPNHKQ